MLRGVKAYMEDIGSYLVAPTDVGERLGMLSIHLSLARDLKLVESGLKHSHG